MTEQERQLIDKLVNSSNQDWQKLIEKLAPDYMKLFNNLTPNHEAAEDYTSQAFMMLVRTIGELAKTP